jgi:hypothetical protein
MENCSRSGDKKSEYLINLSITTPEQMMNVYICLYFHKHGHDAAAYRTDTAAMKAAWNLARKRVDESWNDGPEAAKFKAFDNATEALNFFHEVEADISYGEFFEIIESPIIEDADSGPGDKS